MSKKIEVDGHVFEVSEPKTRKGRCVIQVRGLGMVGVVRDDSDETRTWFTGYIEGVGRDASFGFTPSDAVKGLYQEMINRANPLPPDAGCKDMEAWYEELPDE